MAAEANNKERNSMHESVYMDGHVPTPTESPPHSLASLWPEKSQARLKVTRV